MSKQSGRAPSRSKKHPRRVNNQRGPQHAQQSIGKEQRMQEALNWALSLKIALLMHAHPNHCFDNALDLFLKILPQQVPMDKISLVEGFYVIEIADEVVKNEHGWISLPNGSILDPTMTMLVEPTQTVFYYPGVKRNLQEVQAIMRQQDAWFPYVRCQGEYGEDGLLHPAYRAAHEAALRRLQQLATASGKRQTELISQDEIENDQPGLMIIELQPPEEEQTHA